MQQVIKRVVAAVGALLIALTLAVAITGAMVLSQPASVNAAPAAAVSNAPAPVVTPSSNGAATVLGVTVVSPTIPVEIGTACVIYRDGSSSGCD